MKVPKTTITILAIASLTLGWSLTPLLCFAVHAPSFRAEAIFIPGLSASLLGLAVILLNFALTDKYTWAFPATLGITASGISSIVYSVLIILNQAQIIKQRRKRDSGGTEIEASLLSGAAPVDHSQPSRSAWSTPHLPNSAWSTDGTYYGPSAPNGYQTPRRDSSPQSFHYPNSLQASPSQNGAHIHRPPMPSPPPPGAARNSSMHRSDSFYSTFTPPHAPGEAPVQTLRAPSPAPEEEMTRQQMLRLLVNQTSEQAKRNPENHTFQIEVPRELREALMRGSVDEGDIRHATKSQVEDRGRARARAGSGFERLDGPTRTTAHEKRRSSAVGKSKNPLLNVQNMASPGTASPASMQHTPQSAYAGRGWKTREERRREIENTSGR